MNEIYIGTQFDTQEVNSKKAAVTKFVSKLIMKK